MAAKELGEMAAEGRGAQGEPGPEAAMEVEVPAAAWTQLVGAPEAFQPRCCAMAEFASESTPNNFLKGIKWSPDGLCLLACADDNTVRLFELPSGDEQLGEEGWPLSHDRMRSVLTVREGETIYDMAWLPGMVSTDPATCVFMSTSRDNPVHAWDAFTGLPRGSYCAYTDAEELESALSICFDNVGSNKVYCGYNNCIRVFDLERPGRQHSTIKTFKRAHKQTSGQRGIVSCMEFNPDKSGLVAAGSYSRNVALYDARSGKLLYNMQGQRGGVTQVTWSPEGCYLYSGGRKDDEILCWDVRNTGEVVLSLPRVVRTNQRLQFDVDASGRYLATPSHDGSLRVYDVSGGGTAAKEVCRIATPCACANAAVFHPYQPLLASCTGGRRFDLTEVAEADHAAGESSRASPSEGMQEEAEWVNGVFVWQQKSSALGTEAAQQSSVGASEQGQ
eukprot:CAMPEP_0206266098 /NCGR_PEP_ID=MMETSP0047_2-20121206/30379_1 /ASSEMBLY_ACC=CAM_ASM_000192 /TAXON_ID=195065 /ORGANISM="Chroomonas mesostigmatica_cf, Strain CCMP1168" /LENGTH=446 /DNA_ID=CAMNT_0053694101 /DNA_START=120 /DNA_END=1460 /DNA_ORIENTATION=+